MKTNLLLTLLATLATVTNFTHTMNQDATDEDLQLAIAASLETEQVEQKRRDAELAQQLQEEENQCAQQEQQAGPSNPMLAAALARQKNRQRPGAPQASTSKNIRRGDRPGHVVRAPAQQTVNPTFTVTPTTCPRQTSAQCGFYSTGICAAALQHNRQPTDAQINACMAQLRQKYAGNKENMENTEMADAAQVTFDDGTRDRIFYSGQAELHNNSGAIVGHEFVVSDGHPNYNGRARLSDAACQAFVRGTSPVIPINVATNPQRGSHWFATLFINNEPRNNGQYRVLIMDPAGNSNAYRNHQVIAHVAEQIARVFHRERGNGNRTDYQLR